MYDKILRGFYSKVKTKKIFFLFYVQLIAFSHLFAYDLYFEPFIKNPSILNNICWSDDDSMFAVCEDKYIIIRDSKKYNVISIIQEKNVKEVMFSHEGNQNVLLTLKNNGDFSIWHFNKTDKDSVETVPYFNFNCNNGKKITAFAFSNNSDYIAVAYDDFSVVLYYKLRLTNQAVTFNLGTHDSPVSFLSFSQNDNYLISGSKDGVINLWNCKTSQKMCSITENHAKNKVPAFITNSNDIISATENDSISVFDFVGARNRVLNLKEEICSIKYLPSKNYYAVLTKDNRIHIIDGENGTDLGYVFPVNSSNIEMFEFNSNCTSLIAAYGDGSIYKLDLQKVYLKPDEKPPVIYNGFVEATHPDFVSIYAGGSYCNSSFLFSANLGAEYSHVIKNSPFYFGGGIDLGLVFPSDDLEYTYKINNREADVYLFEPTVFGDFAFFVNPAGKDYFITLETKVGLKTIFDFLYQNHIYFDSNPHFSFYSDIEIGLMYKNFVAKVLCEYDSFKKICPGIIIGDSIKIE